MKTKTLLCFIAIVWMAIPHIYASFSTGDLFKINGVPVPKSEFESYMKCRKGRMGEGEPVSMCFNRFLFDKLKLADAYVQKWDTLPVFKQELKVMLGERLMLVGMNRYKSDSLYRTRSDNRMKRFSSSDEFRFDQIFIPLSQRDGKRQEQLAMSRLDTVYRALLQGADFQSYSSSCPVWASEVELLQEFSSRLRSLSVGQFSVPFSSPLGVHIVRLLQKGKTSDATDSISRFYPFSSYRPDLVPPLFYAGLCTGWAEGKSVAELADMFSLGTLSDSLLISYWDKKNPSPCPKEISSLQLADYFQSHKKDYEWSLPHFKGGIIYCQNKKDASKLKKKLKKLPLNQWTDAIAQWNSDNPKNKADIRTGLFRIGQDAVVDKLVFKCGDGVPNSAYSYSFSLGKCLKHGPEVYFDVADRVKKDFLFSLDAARIDGMSRRFNIEINQNVLNTLLSGKSF